MDFKVIGWPDHLNHTMSSHENIGKIICVYKNLYKGISKDGEINFQLPGKFHFGALSQSEFPVVGDWVTFHSEFIDERNERAALIDKVLPRQSEFSRIQPGASCEEQILAANIDYAFIVTSLNQEFNINRLERYIWLCQRGKVQPLVILSKLDLCDDISPFIDAIELRFPDLSFFPISVKDNIGIDKIDNYLVKGKTSIFIGSSGVGKSTLVNSLLGVEEQAVQSIRENDAKGKHTTTSRELFITPSGSQIIDTAGMRELQIFGDESLFEDNYKKFEILARHCKFKDCQHENEPGCAIQDAIKNDVNLRQEYKNYQKMQRELLHANHKMNKQFMSNRKKKWKQITQNMRRKTRFETKNKF